MSCPAAHPAPTALARLEAGMACRLTLIIAPEGSGKTRLLRKWTEWKSSSRQRTPCWASLTEQDNRLAHFLPHLVLALTGLDVQLDRRLHAVLQFAAPGILTGPDGGQQQAFSGEDGPEGFLIDLVNALSQVPGECALILDEYHQIRTPEIHQAMDFLLEYLPPRMHLYLAARREPPLRLAHLRAHRQMIEIGLAGLFDDPDNSDQ